MSTTYKLIDTKTNMMVEQHVTKSELSELVEAYTDLGYDIRTVSETASGGSTSGSSIAVDMSGGKKNSMKTLKAFMDSFNSRVKNHFKPEQFKPYTITVTEGFDMENVFSRLSSMEKAGSKKKTEGTTFGIEDDSGNLMKVTVRSDQAAEFEAEVAKYLADIKTNVVGLPKARDSEQVSMAELLFKMKDNFDIIDVDFPEIPADVIYNADKASYNTETPPLPGMDDSGEPPMDDLSKPLDLTDFEQQPDDVNADGAEGAEPQDMTGDEDFDTAEDFPEELPTDNSEESILGKVIDMLKSQAEADIERSKADAEKARAEQARLSLQATRVATAEQEEQLRYDLEMEAEKEKEKEAKKQADMARHRISKTMGMASGIREAEEGMTPEMVQRQRQQISLRYKIEPNDSEEMKVYKTKQRAEAMREWNSKFRQAMNTRQLEQKLALKNKQQGKPMQQQQTPQQQQQQQQQQQPNTNNQQANQQSNQGQQQNGTFR